MTCSEPIERRTAQAVSGRSGALPVGPDVGPLRLLVILVGMAVIASGVFVAVSATRTLDDSTPRTAAERTLLDAKSAIEADPRDVDARVTLARAYIGMGQYENARRTLVAADEIEPDNLAIVHMLGRAFLEGGDVASAIEHLMRAADIKGGFAEDYVAIWSDIARARDVSGDLEAAAGAYERALVYAPQAADIIFELAQVYERLGRIDEALSAYEGVTAYIPDHAGALEALERLQSNER